MLLDIIGIIIIVAFFMQGYSKGIIIAAFSFVGIVLGIIIALKLSHTLANYLYIQGVVTSGWAQIISYIVLFTGVVLLVRLIAKALQSMLEAILMGVVNKIAGGILYGALGAIIWSTLLWIGTESHLLPTSSIAQSSTYSIFAPVCPWVFEHLGRLIPFIKNIFADLEQFFNRVNQHK
jgi:membrane protein required for colicin V production